MVLSTSLIVPLRFGSKEVADKRAIDATTSAWRLAFLFLPLKALPIELLTVTVSASDAAGFKTDSAAAFAVFRAESSVPPDARMDLAAMMAVCVAFWISSASVAFGCMGKLLLWLEFALEPIILYSLYCPIVVASVMSEAIL